MKKYKKKLQKKKTYKINFYNQILFLNALNGYHYKNIKLIFLKNNKIDYNKN